MEGARHQPVRSEGTKDAPAEGEPFDGGSATRRKLSRAADTLRAQRGTASNSLGPKARAKE